MKSTQTSKSRTKRHAISLLAFCFFLTAFPAFAFFGFKQADAEKRNIMENIELQDENVTITFSLSKIHQAEKVANDLLIFRCIYPEMAPIRLNGYPQDNVIKIYVSLSSKQGLANYFVSGALPKFDPQRPGRQYYFGTQGIYTIYRQSVSTVSEERVNIFVFKGEDGAVVMVEDPGSWSGSYKADRKIGNHMQLKYLIPKPLGNNFAKIDKNVVAFIQKSIKQ